MPVEAFVAGWLTPRTLRIRRSRAQASPRRVVSLGKKLYSTLSFCTQVYKWVPATSDSTLRFYNSCVNNYFIYCSAAWGNCSHHLLLRLLRLQKRAGCILLDADLSQASISLFLKLNWIPVFDFIKCRKLFVLFIVLLNPNAPKCLRNRFQFLCDSRGPLGRFTRASLYDLKVPCPHSNSGKRTLAYSATKLFNDLSSDLKEFSISSSPLIFKFLPSSLKSKLRSLFFSRLSSAEHLEDLLCSTCRYSIHCYCFS